MVRVLVNKETHTAVLYLGDVEWEMIEKYAYEESISKEKVVEKVCNKGMKHIFIAAK